MKNRKIVVVAFLLVSVLLLGVGYAALTDTLTINGSANVAADDVADAFDSNIYFSKVISGDGCNAVIDPNDNDKGTITVNSGALKAVGDEVIATYTIKSDSDLDVSIAKPIITNTNSEHFEVSHSWAVDQTLESGKTIDVTITIKLIKTDDSIQEGQTSDCEFTITFNPTSIEN